MIHFVGQSNLVENILTGGRDNFTVKVDWYDFIALAEIEELC